jgi:hypothetical protein
VRGIDNRFFTADVTGIWLRLANRMATASADSHFYVSAGCDAMLAGFIPSLDALLMNSASADEWMCSMI